MTDAPDTVDISLPATLLPVCITDLAVAETAVVDDVVANVVAATVATSSLSTFMSINIMLDGRWLKQSRYLLIVGLDLWSLEALDVTAFELPRMLWVQYLARGRGRLAFLLPFEWLAYP